MGTDVWKNLNEVWIPPIEKEGFKEDIIIRRPANIFRAEPEEDGTVLLRQEDAYDGEDGTVLLTRPVAYKAYIERKKTEEKVCLDKEEFIIGKSNSADYTVKENPTISRQHAAIQKTEDGYYLKDLGSSNHTFIDGDKISEPVKLINGTVFVLSDEEFEFILK